MSECEYCKIKMKYEDWYDCSRCDKCEKLNDLAYSREIKGKKIKNKLISDAYKLIKVIEEDEEWINEFIILRKVILKKFQKYKDKKNSKILTKLFEDYEVEVE